MAAASTRGYIVFDVRGRGYRCPVRHVHAHCAAPSPSAAVRWWRLTRLPETVIWSPWSVQVGWGTDSRPTSKDPGPL